MNDLLAVCKEFLAVLGPGGYYPAAGAPLTERLRAAIAKAERDVPRVERFPSRQLLDYLADAVDGLADDYRDSPNAMGALAKASRFIRSTEVNLPGVPPVGRSPEDTRITAIRNQAAKAVPQAHHHGEAPPPTWDQVRLLLAALDEFPSGVVTCRYCGGDVEVPPKMDVPTITVTRDFLRRLADAALDSDASGRPDGSLGMLGLDAMKLLGVESGERSQ